MSGPHPSSAHGRYLAAVRRVQELEAADNAASPDTSLEDAMTAALARDRLAQMTPAQRHAAELDAAKARLSEATAGLTFDDLEAEPRDWNPDDWQAQGDDSEPQEGMVSIARRLGIVE